MQAAVAEPAFGYAVCLSRVADRRPLPDRTACDLGLAALKVT
jgi:hypothetical protein